MKESEIFLKTMAEGLKSLTKALETVAEKMEGSSRISVKSAKSVHFIMDKPEII